MVITQKSYFFDRATFERDAIYEFIIISLNKLASFNTYIKMKCNPFYCNIFLWISLL